MKKYKYLLVDADDTVFDFLACESAAIGAVLARYKLPHDRETVSAYSAINLKYWKAFERGEIARESIFEGRFKEFLSLLNSDIEPLKINADYFVELSNQAVLMPGALQTLRYLSKKYRVFITTNGVTATQIKRTNASGVADLVEKIYISEDIGVQKPSAEYFDFVVNDIGERDRSRYLVIGDSLTSDILGGINAGIDTIWVNARGNPVLQDIQPTYTADTFEDLQKML